VFGNLLLLVKTALGTIGTWIAAMLDGIIIKGLRNAAQAVLDFVKLLLVVPEALASWSLAPLERAFEPLKATAVKTADDFVSAFGAAVKEVHRLWEKFDIEFVFPSAQEIYDKAAMREVAVAHQKWLRELAEASQQAGGIEVGLAKPVVAMPDVEAEQQALNSIVRMYADMAGIASQTEQQMRTIWKGYQQARIKQIDAEAKALTAALPEQADAIRQWAQQMKRQLPQEFAELIPQVDTAALLERQIAVYERILSAGMHTKRELASVWKEYENLRLQQIAREAEALLASGVSMQSIMLLVQALTGEVQKLGESYLNLEQPARSLNTIIAELGERAQQSFSLANVAAYAFASAAHNAVQRMVTNIIGSLKFLRTESHGIFKQMAADFMSMFVEEVLRAMAVKFVIGVLKLLTLFDVASNDRMMMEQGRRGAMFFQRGFMKQFAEFNLAALFEQPRVTAAFPRLTAVAAGTGGATEIIDSGTTHIEININSPVTRADFVDLVESDIVPIIEDAAEARRNRIAMRQAFQTGKQSGKVIT